MEYHSSFSIDKLIENIGPKESKELLSEALPIIIVRKLSILKALEQNDTSIASKDAHRARGSIRLYGSSSLEALLLEVMSLSPGQALRPNLHRELETGFNEAIHEIEERLRVELA